MGLSGPRRHWGPFMFTEIAAVQDDMGDHDMRPDHLLERKEALDLLHSALRRLDPESWFVVCSLFGIHGSVKSGQDILRALGLMNAPRHKMNNLRRSSLLKLRRQFGSLAREHYASLGAEGRDNFRGTRMPESLRKPLDAGLTGSSLLSPGDVAELCSADWGLG